MIMRPLPYIPSSFRPNCPLSPHPLSLHSLTVTQASSHLDTQRLKSLLSQVPLLPPYEPTLYHTYREAYKRTYGDGYIALDMIATITLHR